MGMSWQDILFSNVNFAVSNLKKLIMNIDRMEFMAWMERIMERFDILMDLISKSSKHSTVDGEELLDNQDIFQLLKISARSLQRYRSSGKLPYYTISGKTYYKLTDVNQFVRESLNARIPIAKKTTGEK